MQQIQNVQVPTPEPTLEEMVRQMWMDKYAPKAKKGGSRRQSKSIVDVALENPEFKAAVQARFTEDSNKSITFNYENGLQTPKLYMFDGDKPKIKLTATGDVVYQKQYVKNHGEKGVRVEKLDKEGNPIPEYVPCTHKSVAKELLAKYRDSKGEKGALYVEWLKTVDTLNSQAKPIPQPVAETPVLTGAQPTTQSQVVTQQQPQVIMGAQPSVRTTQFARRGRGK